MSNSIDKATNSFLDMIKLSPKYLIGIMIFTGSILIIGSVESLSSFFGVKEESFKKVQLWISLVFLFSFSLLLAHLLNSGYFFFSSNLNDKRDLKLRQKRLHDLTNAEKQILGKYVFEKTRTQSLSYNSGTVRGLELELIIFRSSDMSQGGVLFPYNIQPWAWDYLNENKHLIEVYIDEIGV